MSEELSTNRLDILPFIQDALKHPDSFSIATQQELSFILRNSGEHEVVSAIQWKFSKSGNDISRDVPVLGWSFWNLNHHSYRFVMLNYSEKLQKLTDGEKWSSSRILENFTPFLGHLGLLCNYINFYRTSERRIQLPYEGIANSYLLKMIIEQSPLHISCLPKDFDKTKLGIMAFDQLNYSFEENGRIRFGSELSSISHQSHPEFDVNGGFRLRLADGEASAGREILNRYIPNSKGKWINVLHIRGTDEESAATSQARDASIMDYFEYCQSINDLGGVVIRMGDNSFPGLPEDFPAFDYANSQIKSEFMDCWLWNECRWWTGNSNGAATVAMAFGKPRLMTNMWYWNIVGSATDIVIPKTLSIGGKVLSPIQTLHSPISRSMSRKRILESGYILNDNSPSQLVAASEEMYYSLEGSGLWKSPVSSIESQFREALGTLPQKTVMRLSPTFLESYEVDIA
jgi:putative glycosyltransferase (TIGR04372 family)